MEGEGKERGEIEGRKRGCSGGKGERMEGWWWRREGGAKERGWDEGERKDWRRQQARRRAGCGSLLVGRWLGEGESEGKRWVCGNEKKKKEKRN